MRRAFALAAAVTLAFSLAGCSDQPAVCDSVDALQASVDNLGDINLSENGVGAISGSLSQIESDLRQVKADASAEWSDQVDGIEADTDELSTTVETAQEGATAATLGAVGTAVRTLLDDVEALAADVGSTC
jgi:predicted extracellular nuclease